MTASASMSTTASMPTIVQPTAAALTSIAVAIAPPGLDPPKKTLLDLPNELQDMIYARCGPRAIKVAVHPWTASPDDQVEQASLKLLHPASYKTIKSLRRTCRKTRERVSRTTFARELAERTSLVIDCRNGPPFDAPCYSPSELLQQGFLKPDLYTAARHVRVIMPLLISQTLLWPSRRLREDIELRGRLEINIYKTDNVDEERYSWSIRSGEVLWIEEDPSPEEADRALAGEALPVVANHLANNLPDFFWDEDNTTEAVEARLLNAMLGHLLDPDDEDPMGRAVSQGRSWKLEDYAWLN